MDQPTNGAGSHVSSQSEAPKRRRGAQPGNRNARKTSEQQASAVAPAPEAQAGEKPKRRRGAKPGNAKAQKAAPAPEAVKVLEPREPAPVKRKRGAPIGNTNGKKGAGQAKRGRPPKPNPEELQPKSPPKIGRPSSYKPEYADQAKILCELGATDADVARFFDVSARTVARWQIEFPLFCQSLKAGKDASDDRVERSLYHRAVGYTFESEKIFQFQGQIVRANSTEHVPPDTTAAIFWLKNRRKDQWRDKQEYAHTGANGGPIAIGAMMSISKFEEIARQVSDEI